MEFDAQPTIQMWATLAITAAGIGLFASQRLPLEIVSLLLLVALLVLFQILPVQGERGENLLGPEALLAGFANPALLSVIALLVIGQGMRRTGALDQLAEAILGICRGSPRCSFFMIFGTAFVLSAFVNNTPVVVAFIPILEYLTQKSGVSERKTMMSLSFTGILAGMTTLIGTSTNLLVSGSLANLGEAPLGFFDFTIPGLVLAAVGLTYIAFVGPRLLADRTSAAESKIAGRHRRFVLRATVTPESGFVGTNAEPHLLAVEGTRLVLVERDGCSIRPPYEDLALQEQDIVVLLATRDAVEEVLARYPNLMNTVSPDIGTVRDSAGKTSASERVLAEVMIAPGSRLVGHSVREIDFQERFKCLVLGIERRAHAVYQSLSELQLEAGDIFVIEGPAEKIARFRRTRNLVLLDGTTPQRPPSGLARRAILIFVAVVGFAATGVLPIVVAAVGGATLMIITGVLDMRWALRAVDRTVILMIGSALALGTALQHTGAANFIAHQGLILFGSLGVPAILSGLFLMVAVMTNVITNNAAAILFTPVAVNVAAILQVDPFVFVLAVLFGANCCFASPVGYQTNLLVMGPGGYNFKDFLIAGGPLVLLIWITFSLFAPYYYGLL